MFTREEVETYPMSYLLMVAGADIEPEHCDEDFFDAINASSRLEVVNDRLWDLDRLLDVYGTPQLIQEFNDLVNEKKYLHDLLFKYPE